MMGDTKAACRSRAPRRTRAGWLALALAVGLALPGAAAGPATAATHPAADVDPVLTLRSLGLEVIENDGFVGASGPASAVRTGADLFAGAGDYALFTGPDETGTGYLALTDDNPQYWVELQVPTATIGSVINDTTDEVGFYTVTGGEGTRDEEVGPGTTANAPAAATLRARPDAAGARGAAESSPGVASGDDIQVPLHVPINVCGNSIDIIGLLNAAAGNTCSNS